MRYSQELIQEWRDIRKAGFLGTIPEYIDYKNNYAKEQRERVDKTTNYDENPFSDDDIPF
jgi:hypothetical protein